MINLNCLKDQKPAQSLLKKQDKDGLVAPIRKLAGNSEIFD
jgi:hypothetical protein